jgi:hypothetical protein
MKDYINLINTPTNFGFFYIVKPTTIDKTLIKIGKTQISTSLKKRYGVQTIIYKLYEIPFIDKIEQSIKKKLQTKYEYKKEEYFKYNNLIDFINECELYVLLYHFLNLYYIIYNKFNNNFYIFNPDNGIYYKIHKYVIFQLLHYMLDNQFYKNTNIYIKFNNINYTENFVENILIPMIKKNNIKLNNNFNLYGFKNGVYNSLTKKFTIGIKDDYVIENFNFNFNINLKSTDAENFIKSYFYKKEEYNYVLNILSLILFDKSNKYFLINLSNKDNDFFNNIQLYLNSVNCSSCINDYFLENIDEYDINFSMEKHKILINTYKYEEINMDNVEKILSNTSILLNSFNKLPKFNRKSKTFNNLKVFYYANKNNDFIIKKDIKEQFIMLLIKNYNNLNKNLLNEPDNFKNIRENIIKKNIYIK